MSMEDFVPLQFAQSMAEAEQLRTILEDHDVEVQIKDEDVEPDGDSDSAGLAVMVPSEHLEEARHILEHRSSIDDELELNYIQTDELEDTDKTDDPDDRIDGTDREGALEDLYDLEEKEKKEDFD